MLVAGVTGKKGNKGRGGSGWNVGGDEKGRGRRKRWGSGGLV